MSSYRIELINSGLSELMKSEDIQGILKDKADDIVSGLKGSYETDVYVGRTRANSSIITKDKDTYFRNLKNNELLKALK